jgi:RNA polymerase sigma-70 factor (ECF subfamily)
MDDTLQRARRGEQAALRELYEAHRDRVLRLAYAVIGDADEAEDVMQDVMVYALTHLESYNPDKAAFGTWLHTITISRSRDRMRRTKVRLTRLASLWRSTDRQAPDPADGLDALEASSALESALASLTPTQREALALRHIEELSFDEVAQVLGVPMRTAQARVNSAMSALRRSLVGPDGLEPRREPLEAKSG